MSESQYKSNKSISPLNNEISLRLREFCEGRYGAGLNAAARGLGMSPENLSQYWTGKSKPGNKLQDRLRSAGCNIGWLITGITEEDAQTRRDRSVMKLIEKGLSKNDYEMLDLLHFYGIKNVLELHDYLREDLLTSRIIAIAKAAGKKHRENS